MVSKAADAPVWEDLKDIKPPMYDSNPLNFDRFLEKLDDWGLTVRTRPPPPAPAAAAPAPPATATPATNAGPHLPPAAPGPQARTPPPPGPPPTSPGGLPPLCRSSAAG